MNNGLRPQIYGFFLLQYHLSDWKGRKRCEKKALEGDSIWLNSNDRRRQCFQRRQCWEAVAGSWGEAVSLPWSILHLRTAGLMGRQRDKIWGKWSISFSLCSNQFSSPWHHLPTTLMYRSLNGQTCWQSLVNLDNPEHWSGWYGFPQTGGKQVRFWPCFPFPQ